MERVAVVGSGISGLATAWLLQRSGKCHVTLLEKESVLGGHTLTDETAQPPVDLGFQVFNLTTYAHFQMFLEALQVPTEESDMSFSLSVDDGKLEWASHNLSTIFAQRANAKSAGFLGMLYDVLRFGRNAGEVLEDEAKFAGVSLGKYLQERRYGEAFIQHYLLPMTAAVWSCGHESMMEFPVVSLVRFWKNHHLLDALGVRPTWRVLTKRGVDYVKRVAATLPDVRTSTGVARVVSRTNGVTLELEGGKTEIFDRVCFATHADTTLQILGEAATEEEKAVLGSFTYQPNDVYLHSDPALMPKLRECWASWNVLQVGTGQEGPESQSVTCTYWLNHLQNLPEGTPHVHRFATLNPVNPPASEHIIRKVVLQHPLFDEAAVRAQASVPSIQGDVTGTNTFFAGAWTANGFHEDGMLSAVAVARAMLPGNPIPWTPRSLSPTSTMWQRLCLRLFDAFATAAVQCGYLRLILPDGTERHYGERNEAKRGNGDPVSVLQIISFAFFPSVIQGSDIGLGESYMRGEFVACGGTGLVSFLRVMSANAEHVYEHLAKLSLVNAVGERLQYLGHMLRDNTVAGSRRNIQEHYDLGNSMYELFLDDSMTYSCGIYPNTGEETEDLLNDEKRELELLHASQINKLDEMIAKANITSDDHVLEIGCGWGSFAMRAASTTGCRVTGITISEEQLALAKQRVAESGLEGQVTLMMEDYRKLVPPSGGFDKIVSIEMLEAVGHDNLPVYFEHVARLLKPGGAAVVQVITRCNEGYDNYRTSSDFIRKHIFPGGHLPSVSALEWAIANTPLAIEPVFTLESFDDIGLDYAPTLRAWRNRLLRVSDKILALGYDEVFLKKWEFYFAFCEAGFIDRYIHDLQLVFRNNATTDISASVPKPLDANSALSANTKKASLQAATSTQLEAATKLNESKGAVVKLPSVPSFVCGEKSERLCAKYPFPVDFPASQIAAPTVASSCGPTPDIAAQLYSATATSLQQISQPGVRNVASATGARDDDFLTRVLLTTWAFLSGCAVERVPVLWFAFVSLATFAVLNWTAQRLLTATESGAAGGFTERRKLGLLGARVVFAFFVPCVALLSLTSLGDGGIFSEKADLVRDVNSIQRALVLVATGYYAYELFDLVDSGLAVHTIARVAYLAGSLVCFATAAFKGVCFPYLCMVLCGDSGVVMLTVRQLLVVRAIKLNLTRTKVLSGSVLLSFVCLRLLPHAITTAHVIADPHGLYDLSMVYWTMQVFVSGSFPPRERERASLWAVTGMSLLTLHNLLRAGQAALISYKDIADASIGAAPIPVALTAGAKKMQ